MFQTWILYIFIRGIKMNVCLGLTVSLKAYSEVIIILILIHRSRNYYMLLPQSWKFFCFVAHNAEKWSPLLPKKPIIFPLCRQRGREV